MFLEALFCDGVGAGDGRKKGKAWSTVSQEGKDSQPLKNASDCSLSLLFCPDSGSALAHPPHFHVLSASCLALQGRAEFTDENRVPDSPESFSMSFAQERFSLQWGLDLSHEPREGRSDFIPLNPICGAQKAANESTAPSESNTTFQIQLPNWS